MPLSPGDKLGHYEVLSLLGQGGMGEVYRARDTTLKRDVAIKVLPALSQRDPERMARFQREAEVLASLDHPNIGHILGTVDKEDSRALVLALIEGPTLADRIETGPLPQDEAIDVARQIIEALEYAHDRGIVHRDLKPANVKITPEGVVKVLDFGLAKVLEDEPPAVPLANSPTLTLGRTHAGVILGTAAYMSPEQAVGRPVDRRSDIFSFGAVLYEILTGTRAFAGTATPDVLEAVVRDNPDWSKLPRDTPTELRKLVERCLLKDRKRRLQAIGEARIVLESPMHPRSPEEPRPLPSPSRLPWALTAALAAVAAVALLGWLRPRPVDPKTLARFTEMLPANATTAVAVSPDGTRIAYAQRGGAIQVRSLEETAAHLIPETQNVAAAMAFSPDGNWIGFLQHARTQGRAQRLLRKVRLSGGAVTTLTDTVGLSLPHLTWAEDDNLYFSSAQGLSVISANGGSPRLISSLNDEVFFASASLLPDRKTILYGLSLRAGQTDVEIGTLDLQSGKKSPLLDRAGPAWFVPTGSQATQGHILYWREGALYAIPFDASLRARTGTASAILPNVASNGLAVLAGISRGGTLAYIEGGVVRNLFLLTWVDRKGAEQPLKAPPRPYTDLNLSPDGRRVATSMPLQGGADVWTYDLAQETLGRLTVDAKARNPVWGPDGKHIFFGASPEVRQTKLAYVPADSSGPPVMGEVAPGIQQPTSVSTDGKWVIGVSGSTRTDSEMWFRPIGGDTPAGGKAQRFLGPSFLKTDPQFSPDGKWVAFASNETGRQEIYVVPFPGPGGKWQISTEGGETPRWSRNGQELFYRSDDRMMVVKVDGSGAVFHPGATKMLFERPRSFGVAYDVSPDGQRFLMTKPVPAEDAEPDRMRIVLNWFEEVRRLSPRP